MTTHNDSWRHTHDFDEGNPLAERNSRWAMMLTLVMMVAEIIGGWYYNSMALLADGWHMSSHALALGLAVAAYGAARRFKEDRRFSWGTWKIEILGGYTSAVLLVAVAGIMLFESVERLLDPSPIHYDQAIGIAIIGLLVNLACAWLLKDAPQHEHHHKAHSHHAGHADNHGHTHEHSHSHDHAHNVHAATQAHDLNQRSAYIHVLSDAATSVLAIIALLGGKFWGFDWLDPVMGIVGGILVGLWAVSLLRDTSRILLDAEMDKPVVGEIHSSLAQSEFNADITDLHVWRVGKTKYACVVTVVSDTPITPDEIRGLLSAHEELAHVSVEVNLREPTTKGV